MNTGIGQQLKDMMRRARNYWAELTDEDRQHQHQHLRLHDEKEEVHQRYGGVREQGDNATSQARSPQMGERSTEAGPSLRASGQTQRQYAQQGGSGSQKPLAEQLGNEASNTTPSKQQTQASQKPRQGPSHH